MSSTGCAISLCFDAEPFMYITGKFVAQAVSQTLLNTKVHVDKGLRVWCMLPAHDFM